jgi:hypothetical protein
MKSVNWLFVAVLAIVTGCSNADVTQTADHGAAHVPDSRYAAEAEPDAAMPVGEARESVEHEQTVTLVGTIGGSSEPFVDGLTAFTIVDAKVPYCSADDGCPTPWDYCCTQDQVKDNIATVKIVDESGIPIAGDARKLLGVKELSTVVVRGNAQRDDQKNLTIAANQIFVRPGE